MARSLCVKLIDLAFCNLQGIGGQGPPFCVEWALTESLPRARLCPKYVTRVLSLNPQDTHAAGTIVGPILWSWIREIMWEVAPRFKLRPPDSRAFNHSVTQSLILARGLLIPGPRPDQVLWLSSALGERILHSYFAGSPIHLIKEALQNIKAFGDPKNVFTIHNPSKYFLKLLKAFTFNQSAL